MLKSKKTLLRVVAFLLILFVIFIYFPRTVTEPTLVIPSPEQDLNVVAVGDSLTRGVGDATKKGYVGYVRERLEEREQIGNVIVHNFGVRGDTSDALLEKLQSETVLEQIRRADLIMFTIGGNDLMNIVKNHFLSLTLDLFEERQRHYVNNLERIFTVLREQNEKAKIIYIGIFHPFSTYFPNVQTDEKIINDWNEAGAKVTSHFERAVFVPTIDLFADRTEELISDDRFHPNEKGYRLIGERVLAEIDTGNATYQE